VKEFLNQSILIRLRFADISIWAYFFGPLCMCECVSVLYMLQEFNVHYSEFSLQCIWAHYVVHMGALHTGMGRWHLSPSKGKMC